MLAETAVKDMARLETVRKEFESILERYPDCIDTRAGLTAARVGIDLAVTALAELVEVPSP